VADEGGGELVDAEDVFEALRLAESEGPVSLASADGALDVFVVFRREDGSAFGPEDVVVVTPTERDAHRFEAVEDAEAVQVDEAVSGAVTAPEEHLLQLRAREDSMACHRTREVPIPVGQPASERQAKLDGRPTGWGPKGEALRESAFVVAGVGDPRTCRDVRVRVLLSGFFAGPRVGG
jgi:hypothetical protein